MVGHTGRKPLSGEGWELLPLEENKIRKKTIKMSSLMITGCTADHFLSQQNLSIRCTVFKGSKRFVSFNVIYA